MRVSRREFFGLAGAYAVATVALSLVEADPGHILVKPPGALSGEQFLQTCIRCGACVRTCPIQELKISDLTYGFSNIGTPRLVGYCMVYKDLEKLHGIQEVEDQYLANANREFALKWKLNVRDKGQEEKCYECVKICPSGALRDIPPDQIRIGIAVVNKDLCKDWHIGSCTHDCLQCCPFDAIDLTGGPVVNEAKCVGCNICNLVCVSETTPRAIGVESMGIEVSG